MTLGQQIAQYLGEHFYAVPIERYSNAVIIRNKKEDDAFGIIVWAPETYRKIFITGTYPESKDNREFPEFKEQIWKIVITKTHPPSDIAEDIVHRFLPAYIPIFKKACKVRDEYNEFLAKQKQLTQRFVNILHGEVLSSGDRIKGGPLVYAKHSKVGYLMDLYVNTNDQTINFDLRGVPTDLAETLLRTWLEGWRPECRYCHEFLDEQDKCNNKSCGNYDVL